MAGVQSRLSASTSEVNPKMDSALIYDAEACEESPEVHPYSA